MTDTFTIDPKELGAGHRPEVLSALSHGVLQALRQTGHKATEMGTLQCTPHLLIRVVVEGVKVHPEGPREQNWVLHRRAKSTQGHIEGGVSHPVSRLQC